MSLIVIKIYFFLFTTEFIQFSNVVIMISLLIMQFSNVLFIDRNLPHPTGPLEALSIEGQMTNLRVYKGLVTITNRDCVNRLFSGALHTRRLIVCYAANVYRRDAATLDALVGNSTGEPFARYQLIEKYLHTDYQPEVTHVSQIAILKVTLKRFKYSKIINLDVISYWIISG